MLNCSGFNIGNFCFPVIQAFMGPSALVTASMFDIGNSVIVTAGSNVMTTSLLHIDMDRPLTEQHAGAAPTLPYSKPRDKDARRLAAARRPSRSSRDSLLRCRSMCIC